MLSMTTADSILLTKREIVKFFKLHKYLFQILLTKTNKYLCKPILYEEK